jgi:hypothetical protein
MRVVFDVSIDLLQSQSLDEVGVWPVLIYFQGDVEETLDLW